MKLTNRLSEYVRACFSGIWIESHEHQDALTEIAKLCLDQQWQLATWDIESGLNVSGQAEQDVSSKLLRTAKYLFDRFLMVKINRASVHLNTCHILVGGLLEPARKWHVLENHFTFRRSLFIRELLVFSRSVFACLEKREYRRISSNLNQRQLDTALSLFNQNSNLYFGADLSSGNKLD